MSYDDEMSDDDVICESEYGGVCAFCGVEDGSCDCGRTAEYLPGVFHQARIQQLMTSPNLGDQPNAEALIAARFEIQRVREQLTTANATIEELRKRVAELEPLEDAAIEFAKTMDIAANMESDKDGKWRKALMTHAESGRKLAVLARQAAERRKADSEMPEKKGSPE
jgi:hypothetical protein